MIAQVVVLLSLAALAVYSIVVLARVRDVLGNIQRDVRDVSTRAVPVLENLDAITGKLRTITDNFQDQVSIVRDSVLSLKTVTDNILDFERRVQREIETPVLEVAGVVASIVRAIGAFIDRIRGR